MRKGFFGCCEGDCGGPCGDNPPSPGSPNVIVSALVTPQIRAVSAVQPNPNFNTNTSNLQNWIKTFKLNAIPWGKIHTGTWADWQTQDNPTGEANLPGNANTSLVPDSLTYGFLRPPASPEITVSREDDFCCELNRQGNGFPLVSASFAGWAHSGYLNGNISFVCAKSEMLLADLCNYYLLLYADPNQQGFLNASQAIRICAGISDGVTPIEIPMPTTKAGVIPFLTRAALSAFTAATIRSFAPLYLPNQICFPATGDPFFGS